MPYLRLIELAAQRTIEIREGIARLGRSPECTVVFSGEDAGVVSGQHAEIRHAGGTWRLVDLSSRNGTFLDGRRLLSEARLGAGDEIRLGETGPRLSVAAVTEALPPTLPERPGITPPLAERSPETRAYGVTLLDAVSGRRHEARGTRIRLGRGRECEIQPVEPFDTTVSRVHAELTVGASGGLMLRDLRSRNGTFINDQRMAQPLPIRLGDRIMVGQGGPVLIVEGLGTSPQVPVARSPALIGQRRWCG